MRKRKRQRLFYIRLIPAISAGCLLQTVKEAAETLKHIETENAALKNL